MKPKFLAVLAAFIVVVTGTGFGLGISMAAPGDQVVLDGQGWTCNSAVDLDLVKVTNPPGDGVRLSAGCTGSIDRIEVSGVRNGDGIKVSNPSSGHAHDLTIGGGYVQCQAPTDGTHQDGIQAMGGERITIRDVVFDCVGGGGGNYFIQRAVSSATPTDIVCEGCAVSPRHPNAVNLGASIRSGMRDSLICEPFSGRNPWMDGEATDPVNLGNEIVPNSDPRCASLETLTAWTGSVEEPPPTTTEPPPTEPPCDEACVQAYEDQIASLTAQLGDANAEITLLESQLADAYTEIARLQDILSQIHTLSAP